MVCLQGAPSNHADAWARKHNVVGVELPGVTARAPGDGGGEVAWQGPSGAREAAREAQPASGQLVIMPGHQRE
eukprot:3455909-Pyramimonas_sp.AAC.1